MPPSRGLRPAVRSICQACGRQGFRRDLTSLTRSSTRTLTAATQRQPSLTSVIPSTLALDRRSPQSLSQQPQHRYASSESNLNHTPLYDLHVKLGAKMVPFANYSMPLEYPDQSHPESHRWTRSNASLFDVSHMVQHKLSGRYAEEFLMTITPSAIDSLPKHTSTLSTLLDPSGGIIDDTVITRLGRDSFYFVTNAGCREDDLNFIREERSKFLDSKGSTDEDITWHVLDNHSLLALQGPKALEVLQPLIFRDEDDSDDTDLSTLYFSHSRWLRLNLPGSCTPEHTDLSTPSLLISRTGYTGEDGFEISIPPENGSSAGLAQSIATAFTSSHGQEGESSTESSCKWAGLAARDSLRLEAGMCLYGHDIGRDTTPPVAALGWVVPKARRSDNPSPAFNGHETVNAQLAEPKSMDRRRVGLEIEAGPAAREGAEIVELKEDGSAGEVIGKITSGCPSPSLQGKNIAMGYVKNGWHKRGTNVGVLVRKKVRKGTVAKMPFVESKFYRGEGK